MAIFCGGVMVLFLRWMVLSDDAYAKGEQRWGGQIGRDRPDRRLNKL